MGANMMRCIGRWAVLMSAWCTVVACNQPERVGSTPPVDPRRSYPFSEYSDLTLRPMVLISHADYDQWEKAVSARGGAQLVYTLYKEAMLRQRGDQRTFVRWILSTLNPELDEQYRRGLQPFIQSLMKSPEVSSDARYLFGQLAWYQLREDPLGADAPKSTLQPTLIDTIERNWRQLITDDPRWRGPYGLSAADLQDKLNALAYSVVPPAIKPEQSRSDSTFSAEIEDRIERAYKTAGRQPPWREKVAESEESLVDFYQAYEERGGKKACQRVDQALALVQDPTAVGDAYAHCALDRKNPFSALDQVRRMIHARQPGGLNLILERLQVIAQVNPRFAKEFDNLLEQIRSLVLSDRIYAESTGLAAWLDRGSSD